MNEYLFSYGTLQNEQTQMDLFGRVLQGLPDILRGYKVSTIEITDKTFLSKCELKYQHTLNPSGEELDFIKGTVLEVTQKELLRVDEYEPDNYKRSKVMLESGKEAWIYVAGTIMQ